MMTSVRAVVVLLAISASANASPHAIEAVVDASGGLPFGHTEADNSMDHRVSGNIAMGIGAGYRFTARTSAGVFVEYGLADAVDDHGSGRMLRIGAYGRRLYQDFSLSVRAGYEQLDVTYVFPGVENDDAWRGVELLRPELGITAYQGPDCTVDLYAAISLGMFEYRASNGNGSWIGHEMTDTPSGVALHGWLMLGTRVVFDAF
jgi:hypothetical protein